LLAREGLAAWSALGDYPTTNAYNELWVALNEHRSASGLGRYAAVVAGGHTNAWTQWPSYGFVDLVGDELAETLPGRFIDHTWLAETNFANLDEYFCDGRVWGWVFWYQEAAIDFYHWDLVRPGPPVLWTRSNLWVETGVGTQYVVETICHTGQQVVTNWGWEVEQYETYQVRTTNAAPYSDYQYSYPWTLSPARNRTAIFAQWRVAVTNSYVLTNVVDDVTNTVPHRQLGLRQTTGRPFDPLIMHYSKWTNCVLKISPPMSVLAGTTLQYTGTYCEVSATAGVRSAVAVQGAVVLGTNAVSLGSMLYGMSITNEWTQDVTNGQPDSALGAILSLAWSNTEVTLYGDPRPGWISARQIEERRRVFNNLKWAWLDAVFTGGEWRVSASGNDTCDVGEDVPVQYVGEHASDSVTLKAGGFYCLEETAGSSWTNCEVTRRWVASCEALACDSYEFPCPSATWSKADIGETNCTSGGVGPPTTNNFWEKTLELFSGAAVYSVPDTNGLMVGGEITGYAQFSGYDNYCFVEPLDYLIYSCEDGWVVDDLVSVTNAVSYQDAWTFPPCFLAACTSVYGTSSLRWWDGAAGSAGASVSSGATNLSLPFGLSPAGQFARLFGEEVYNLDLGEVLECDFEGNEPASPCVCDYDFPELALCWDPGGGTAYDIPRRFADGTWVYTYLLKRAMVDVVATDPHFLFVPTFSYVE